MTKISQRFCAFSPATVKNVRAEPFFAVYSVTDTSLGGMHCWASRYHRATGGWG